MEFRALGSLAVMADGRELSVGGPRQRRLLAMLLIHRNTVVSVDRLADAVFAGEPTDAARTTMRSYIARIRRVIGDDTDDVALVTQAPGYALRVAPEVVDAGRFEMLLGEATQRLAVGDPAAATVAARQALATWNGDAFAEFADEEWAQPEAQRLEELRLVANERLIEAELACGHAGEAIARLEQLTGAHPLRESFRSQLMLALYRSGRQVDALRAFRDYRTTLADEIGLDPSPALVDLERRILDHDPRLELADAAGEPLRGYRLGARLGTGPNGTIHLAHVPGVEREVTLSALRGPRVDEVDFVRRFEANATAIGGLRHPAIVGIVDYWREPGAAYVVAQRPRGVSLRDRLERGPLTAAELAELVRRVGGALVHAASRGVQHGWITLDNIVIDDGAAALANFVVCPTATELDTVALGEVLATCVDRTQLRDADSMCRRVHAVVERASELPMDEFVAGILAIVTATDVEVAGEDARPNPFKGLRAFDESDADDFHGRDEIVDELVHRLGVSHFTLVVGGSGSGKSSLVRAGLVPRVRRGDAGTDPPWFATTMMPGSAPFKELAEALRRVSIAPLTADAAALRDGASALADAVSSALPAGGRLLLVIDQFEELFTLAPPEDERRFLDVLAATIDSPRPRVHIVATMRADFYDRPLAHQRFGALVGDATVPLAAMTAAGIEAAITRPLDAVGATAEPALVAELLAGVVGQPSALPSLQFTLFELAGRRADQCLTLADYHDVGGIDQSIAVRAERMYTALDTRGQAIVRRVFEDLVAIEGDAEPTARRRARADLAAGTGSAEVQMMLDDWMAARLLTGDHDPRSRVPTVQLAHEAILRSWPRLAEWIADDRQAIIVRERLRDAAQEWAASGGDEALLYRGLRLDAAVELARERNLSELQQRFVEAGDELRDREARAAAELAVRQSKANRRLRIQVGMIATALVVALIVGLIAIDQRGDARNAAAAADGARRDATARELAAAAESNVERDPERAIHLAVRAVEETRRVDGSVLPQAIDALHHAVTSSRVMFTVPDVGGRLDTSPTDDLFVTEGPEETGMIDVRSASTGESVRMFRGDDVDVNDVEFSPDGTRLAVVGDDGSAEVFDVETGTSLNSVIGDGPVWSPSFDASGDLLLTYWSTEGVVRLTDLTTGESTSVPASVNAVQMSPSGDRVAVSLSDEPYAMVVDVATQEVVVELEGLDDLVYETAWSPDGSKLLTAGLNDGTFGLFDAATGERLATGTHPELITVAWSPDGTRAATGGYDGTTRVWDVSEGSLDEAFRFQVQDLASGVPGVAFTHDGSRLVASDWDITSTKVFDLSTTGAGELGSVEVDPWVALDLLPDSAGLVGVAPDGRAAIIEPKTGELVRRLGTAEVIWPGVEISADGTVAAVWTLRDEIEIVDTSDGAVLGKVSVADDPDGWGVAVSGDGRYVALSRSVNDDADIQVLVADRSGTVLNSWVIPDSAAQNLSFSADGNRLAATQSGRERADPALDLVKIWDWRRGEVVGELPTKGVDVVFDRTGRWIATTRFNEGEADVWDATTYEPVVTLSGSESILNQIAFSADGELLATAGRDGVATIWDRASGLERQRFVLPTEAARVAFDPTGTMLATTDDAGVARVWTLDTEELLEIARTRVTRDLTDPECRQYLHVESCAAA
jgi:WD40 repeat protein/DNA-binding SARP family transcriptional activator